MHDGVVFLHGLIEGGGPGFLGASPLFIGAGAGVGLPSW